jgi:hypothetical protein
MRPPGLCFIVLACALLLGEAASAQETIAHRREYYLRYCASCHGKDGDGLGPIASAGIVYSEMQCGAQVFSSANELDRVRRCPGSHALLRARTNRVLGSRCWRRPPASGGYCLGRPP